MPKLPSHARVKRHAVYTVAEAAEVTGMHRRTVMRWIKGDGLDAVTDARPWLIEGAVLKDWLLARREDGRCRLAPDALYCLACRTAVRPDPALVEVRPHRAGTSLVVGLCPLCTRLTHRIVRTADLPAVWAAAWAETGSAAA
ncbi:MAG: helix-turn-helix domain-containing protein [Pseudomonadota bacterium]